MKFFNELLLDINECLSTFDENRSSGGAVVTLFQKFSALVYLTFYKVEETARKFMSKLYIIRNNIHATWVHMLQQRVLSFRFHQNSCDNIVMSRILLYGIIQNFACNMLAFKDDIGIFFAGIAN